MKYLLSAVIAFSLFLSLPASAGNATDQFARCMVDTLNGKERKSLAKWIFLAMAAHPEISPYSKATSNDVDLSNQYVGKLITRILTEDCPVELAKANKEDPMAVQKGFELVGRVAMQELMTNQAVTRSLTGYVKYTDQKKITEILQK